jgi:DNA-binding transcriptional LysR family regulator
MTAYTLRQLRYFVTTVECGSVAEASRQLDIAQPSISAAIKGLEECFDLQLFIRHQAHGMSLTPTGARFFRQAQDLLRQAYEFEQNALADNDVISGKVDVGCYETSAPLHLPRILATFSQQYPGVTVRVHDGQQHELLSGLGAGRFDLAILFRHGLGADIEVESLGPPMRPHVLLPEGHPLTHGLAVSLHDLVKEPMIQLDVQPSRDYFHQVFAEHGLEPQVAYRSPSIEMVRGMVGQGFGFSLLVTRPFGDRTYDGKKVVTRPLAEAVSRSELVMAWHQRNHLTRPARLFLDHCKAVLGARPGDAQPHPDFQAA